MERKKRSKGSVWEFCYANFFLRDVWIRNKSVRAEICQILHTDTHPHTHTQPRLNFPSQYRTHFRGLSGHNAGRFKAGHRSTLAFLRNRGNWNTQAHTGRSFVDYAAHSKNIRVSEQLGTFGRHRIHAHVTGNWTQ